MQAYIITNDEVEQLIGDNWTKSMSKGSLFNDVAKLLAKAQGTEGEVLLQPVDLPWGQLWVDEEGIPKGLPRNERIRSYYGETIYGPAYARIKKGYSIADVLTQGASSKQPKGAPTDAPVYKRSIVDVARDGKTTEIVKVMMKALDAFDEDLGDLDRKTRFMVAHGLPYMRLYMRAYGGPEMWSYYQTLTNVAQAALVAAAHLARGGRPLTPG